MRRVPTPRLGRLARIALALACVLLAAGALFAAPEPPPSQGLQVNLEGVPLKDFLRLMGQYTGKSPVFREDQIPRAEVTLLTRQPAGEADLQALFGLVLSAAGLHAAQKGETLYVLPGLGPGQSVPAVSPAEGQHILVMRLPGGLEPERAARLVERLRSDQGQVRSAAKGWAVVLRDAPERAARARTVLESMVEAPAGASTELYPLRKALAKLAARKLDMYFRGLAGRPPSLLALDWSNSVLVTGSPEQLAQALRLLSQMDDAPREAPALKAFRLRFIKAEKLAQQIAALVGASSPEPQGEAPRPGTLRVTVDAEANAVLVLAEPELMARLETLVAELDQPKPRILLEALVLEVPGMLATEVSALPGPGAALVLAQSKGPGKPFQVQAGALAQFRGKSAQDLDQLAEMLALEPRIRVLARPRVAAQDGSEVRVISGPAAAPAPVPGLSPSPAPAERFRLVAVPRLEPDGGVAATLSLADGLDPGPGYGADLRLGEGLVLVLRTQREAPAKPSQGFALFSAQPKPEDLPSQLVLVLSGRLVRQAAPSRGLSPQAEPQPAARSDASGPAEPRQTSEHP